MFSKEGKTTIALLLWVLFATLVWQACDGDGGGPTTPDPPPPTTTIPPVEPPTMPRVDSPFSWQGFYGFTAFALGHPGQSENDVRRLFSEAMSYGWNTARICSETEFWDGSLYWLVSKPRDIERLKWLLDIIASIPGAQVLLIGDCTLKGPVTEEAGREWARSIGRLIREEEYQNIAIETHNEFDNCRNRGWGPHCPGKQDVAEHIRIYRNFGVEYVTADDRVCKPDLDKGVLGFRLANIGAYPADFHPCRTYPNGGPPWDPNRRFLREMVAVNGMILLGETIAWGDDGNCSGLRTCDQNRINTFIRQCNIVDNENGGDGCKYVFHTVNLLGGESPGWWAQARQ